VCLLIFAAAAASEALFQGMLLKYNRGPRQEAAKPLLMNEISKSSDSLIDAKNISLRRRSRRFATGVT
jgi:hypothetical protein